MSTRQTEWVSAAESGGTPEAPLDAPTAIFARRATKQFKPDPLPEGVLERLAELTTAAPSGFNVQDWRIVIVTSPEQKTALAEAAYNQPQVLTAPATFVFAADVDAARNHAHLAAVAEVARARGAWSDGYAERFPEMVASGHEALGPRMREYAVKNAMLAAAHLLVAAASMGLDSSPMNGWVEDEVKKVIGAAGDPNIAIAVIVSVGYGEGGHGRPGRLPRSANVFIDRLGNPFE